MKRFAVALPVVAAMVLFCATAYAADASILPEPVQAHWLIALMAVMIPAVRTALSNDTVKLPTAAAPWRAAIVAILAGASTFVDQLVNGFDLKSAALSFLMLALPSIVQEILKVVFGAGPPSNSSGMGGGGSSVRPPPGYSTKMAAVAFCVMALSGCAAKPYVCPTLKLLSDNCNSFLVVMPDGTTEVVPKEAILGAAMGARAQRMGAAQAADAGADR